MPDFARCELQKSDELIYAYNAKGRRLSAL